MPVTFPGSPLPDVPVDVEIRFDTAFPYTACLVFPLAPCGAGSAAEVCRQFSGDLLNKGRHALTGTGDVRIGPDRPARSSSPCKAPAARRCPTPRGRRNSLPRGLIHAPACRTGDRTSRCRIRPRPPARRRLIARKGADRAPGAARMSTWASVAVSQR
ncbi:SsgA family sporulation/cell division regulator [Kitasatospora sp. NPDC056076]|uniref:SsgA family sporulation/cell division regulator n=1 Tax=Kitasatospora sp. NPDC056076 TaxID=3345703 RepID=UPI0035D698FE